MFFPFPRSSQIHLMSLLTELYVLFSLSYKKKTKTTKKIQNPKRIKKHNPPKSKERKKKAPPKSKKNQEDHKNTSAPGHVASPKAWFIEPHFISESPLEKVDFPFASGYQLQTASWLGVEPCVQLPPLSAGTPCGLNLGRPWACCQSVRSYVSQSVLCVWKPLFPWWHLHPLALSTSSSA